MAQKKMNYKVGFKKVGLSFCSGKITCERLEVDKLSKKYVQFGTGQIGMFRTTNRNVQKCC